MIGDNLIAEMKKKILAAKQIALNKKQPLLILLGEGHMNFSSYYMEIIIILMARELLSIKNIMFETDKKGISDFKANAKGTKFHNCYPNMFYLYHFLEKYHLNIQPIDSGKNRNNPDWNKLPEGAKFRNNKMSQNLHFFSPNEDRIAVVGFNHLYGLMRETNLSANFHVLPINITPEFESCNLKNYSKVCHQFAFGDDVMQFSQKLQYNSNKQVEKMATDTLKLLECSPVPLTLNNPVKINTSKEKIYSGYKRNFIHQFKAYHFYKNYGNFFKNLKSPHGSELIYDILKKLCHISSSNRGLSIVLKEKFKLQF